MSKVSYGNIKYKIILITNILFALSEANRANASSSTIFLIICFRIRLSRQTFLYTMADVRTNRNKAGTWLLLRAGAQSLSTGSFRKMSVRKFLHAHTGCW